MIGYDSGRWGVRFIFQCKGSVFPRSVTWATPSAILAAIISMSVPHDEDVETVISQAWFAMSFVVGFLIVFRTQQGYARYWEGASLLQNVKASWLNSCSNLITFCSARPERQEEVMKFQHLLVRLMSLLHCSALQSVSMMSDSDFDIIDATGLSPDFLQHVRSHEDNKCFIVLQAVQQLIVDNIRCGVIEIAPPIVSRVFQELSNGIVAVTNVRKITDIPFPFPYAQLVTVMLLVSWLFTPFVTGFLLSSPIWASALTFVGQLGFWSINYIAAEIELPFGDDDNDLPINEMQREMNECLKLLMNPLSQNTPSFDFDVELHSTLPHARSSSVMEHPKEQVPEDGRSNDGADKSAWARLGFASPTKLNKRMGVYHKEKVWKTHVHHHRRKDGSASEPSESECLSPRTPCSAIPASTSHSHHALHHAQNPSHHAVRDKLHHALDKGRDIRLQFPMDKDEKTQQELEDERAMKAYARRSFTAGHDARLSMSAGSSSARPDGVSSEPQQMNQPPVTPNGVACHDQQPERGSRNWVVEDSMTNEESIRHMVLLHDQTIKGSAASSTWLPFEDRGLVERPPTGVSFEDGGVVEQPPNGLPFRNRGLVEQPPNGVPFQDRGLVEQPPNGVPFQDRGLVVRPTEDQDLTLSQCNTQANACEKMNPLAPSILGAPRKGGCSL